MLSANESDALLIERVRAGDANCWQELIARFEGRLLAFVQSRLRDRAASEDVVQETFLGFLHSLPNFDPSRPLETWLFSIAAHKLTDHLRREGRRPTLPLSPGSDSLGEMPYPAADRGPSSIARGDEQRGLEEQALAPAMGAVLARWKSQGHAQKVFCLELLIVCGMANKDAAAQLGISEQTVANYKYEFLDKLRQAMRQANLPPDVFPELIESEST